MDRTALDALNKGWALGIGTRVQTVDVDFEAARARGAAVEPKSALRWSSTLSFWQRC